MNKIIVAYVPALHEGYIRFFRKHLESEPRPIVYLVSEEILGRLSKDIPHYGRDVRAVEPKIMQNVLSVLCAKVYLFEDETITWIQKQFLTHADQIIMPKEDISFEISKRYFEGKNVVFESVFLRWDKLISQAELQVSPHRIISTEEFDREMIAKAETEAEKSSDFWRQVGAVAVKDGKIIAGGFNRHMPEEQNNNVFGDPRSNFNAGERIDLCSAIHAEASVIAKAARSGIALDGASIYVNIFPCPSCAKLIKESGIRKVYYSKGYSVLDAENIFKACEIEIILVK